MRHELDPFLKAMIHAFWHLSSCHVTRRIPSAQRQNMFKPMLLDKESHPDLNLTGKTEYKEDQSAIANTAKAHTLKSEDFSIRNPTAFSA
jgi:hypothetical protein